MKLPTGRFRRSDRLLKSRDFRRVSGCGVRAASRNFVLLASAVPPNDAKNPQMSNRLGVTVSRRVGNAVARNRIKRRIREWFRHLEASRASSDCSRGAPGGTTRVGNYELVVIARRDAAEIGYAEVTRDLTSLFERARSSPPPTQVERNRR